MWVLRTRDGNYRKRGTAPTAKNPVWTTPLDEPCPTISAADIRGCFVSGHYLEFDGALSMSDVPRVPRTGHAAQLFDGAASKPPYRVPLLSEIRKIKPNGFKVATTFAGTGGSSTGYRLAGFQVVWANEFVPIAQESYRANAMPYTVIDGRDIKQVTAADILAATKLKRGELDIFDGSPPCQAFSTAGKREKGWGTERHYEHGASQKNEELFFDYIRLRDGLMPKVFVAENVSGLVKGTAKGFFLEILKELRRGYRVTAPLLDAQWLGVPQARQRIVFIGVREDLGAEPPVIKPLPYRYSVRDALPWLSRVVHDTRGSFKSGGTITDRPSVAICASPIDAHHFQVHDGVEFDTKGTGTPNGPIQIADRPAPTISASARGQFKVTSQGDAEVVQNSNATHSRKGERRTIDAPAPTLLARRANLEVQLLTNSSFQERRVSLDNPSPTIMAGGPGKTSGMIVHTGRKIAVKDVVPENVGASLEGYAVGEEWDKLNPGQQSDKFFSLVRPDADEPCPTITASGGGGEKVGAPGGIAGVAHPTEKRKFSILEVKRLCSFPDDFELKGTYGQQWERLGNSVPPVMMQHVAEAIRDHVLKPARRPPVRQKKAGAKAAPARNKRPAARL